MTWCCDYPSHITRVSRDASSWHVSSHRIITRTLLISGPDTLTEKNSKWSPWSPSLGPGAGHWSLRTLLTVLSMLWCPVMVLLYTACPWLMWPGTWLTPIIVMAGLRSASIITIHNHSQSLTDLGSLICSCSLGLTSCVSSETKRVLKVLLWLLSIMIMLTLVLLFIPVCLTWAGRCDSCWYVQAGGRGSGWIINTGGTLSPGHSGCVGGWPRLSPSLTDPQLALAGSLAAAAPSPGSPLSSRRNCVLLPAAAA